MSNDTKQIAQRKVMRALTLIEHAQTLLSDACSELCSIDGACDQWEIVGDHYEHTKALWHRVNESIEWDVIDLDSDAKRAHAKKVEKGL